MRGETTWIVPPDHPAFAGHFPGTPIVPGVVLLDQALHAVEEACGVRLAPGQIAAAKFLRPVGPGAALLIRYVCEANGTLRIEILSGTDKVASASFAPSSSAGGAP
jgi:3-hydroxymyristoyl/3-hydroxydecanoyl-(acyl carrier protein) dehydratase